MNTQDKILGMDENGWFNNDFNDIAKSILLSRKDNDGNKVYGYLDNDNHQMQCNEITPPSKKELPDLPEFFKNNNFIVLVVVLFFYNLFSYYLVYLFKCEINGSNNKDINDIAVSILYNIFGVYPHFYYDTNSNKKEYFFVFIIFLLLCYGCIMYAGTNVLPKYTEDSFGSDFIKNGYLFGIQFFVLFPSILCILLIFYYYVYKLFTTIDFETCVYIAFIFIGFIFIGGIIVLSLISKKVIVYD